MNTVKDHRFWIGVVAAVAGMYALNMVRARRAAKAA